jgi:hypothetical protein
LAAATPASAAVDQCFVTGNTVPQCPQTDTNVLLTNSANANTINSNFNGSAAITGTFTSSEAIMMGGSGQATVLPVSGLLNTLTYTALGYTFTTATFNLIGDTGTTVNIFGYDAGGNQFVRTLTTGQNFTGLLATGSDVLTGFSISSAAGISSFEQLRLGGVQQITTAVPEPATWALMLMGFGGMGLAMRRNRRRSVAQLAQMA